MSQEWLTTHINVRQERSARIEEEIIFQEFLLNRFSWGILRNCFAASVSSASAVALLTVRPHAGLFFLATLWLPASNDPFCGGLCTYLLWHIFLLQRFLVCVSIVDFWFAVILKFWCESLYVYEIVLSCCSLNCKFISSVLHLYPPLLMISDFGGIIVHGWFRIFTVYIPLLVSLVICGIFVSCCCLFCLEKLH